MFPPLDVVLKESTLVNSSVAQPLSLFEEGFWCSHLQMTTLFFASIEDRLLLIKMDLLIWSLNIRLELPVFVQLIFRMRSLLDMHYFRDSILSLSLCWLGFGLSSRPLLSLYDTH